MTKEAIEQTFHVHAPAQLSLANISGSVEIMPGETDMITVKAFKNLEEGDSKRSEVEMTQAEDGSVSIKTHYRPESWLSFLHWEACDVEYKVSVPTTCKLNVSGVSNTLLIQDIEGEMRLSTVSGDVALKDLRGKIELKAVSGNITGERLNGAVCVNIVSGDTHFSASNFSSLEVKTISGDCEAETMLGPGPYSFDAISGDVRLILPGESRFIVHSSSLSGDLKSFLPVDPTTRQESGPAIKHHSISGDLHIDSSQTTLGLPVNPLTPVLEPETPATDTRTGVLDRLARGEISVDQALQLLNNVSVLSR